MRRLLLTLCGRFALLLLPVALGCHEPKIETFEERETIRESEPQMVAPGEPIVE